ncbi:MAG: electron transfer flavoprotein subunit alpha/FixB family protein [Acidilobaceae archaeon]
MVLAEKSIWVFIEQEYGVIEESSLEVLSKAREITDKSGGLVTGILLGWNIRDKARELGRYGAHKVIVVEDKILETYLSEPYADIVGWLIEERKPDYFLASATRNGRDLAGRLAVRFKTGLQAHVIELDINEDGLLVGHVPGFGGNIVAVVKNIKGKPQMATVAIGVFTPKKLWSEAEVEVVDYKVEVERLNMRIIERVKREVVDISKSKRVVVAGMGTGGDLELVRKLSETIAADIGVTRPLADIGVAPRDIQIGSTGVSLNADLAIIVGASGAPHFVSGIRNVKTVISINKDPEAPIKEFSDYYIIGDLFEILPRLIEKLKR